MSDLSKKPKKQTDISKLNVVSMTSLEIAELTGKRHDHVTRDIKNMLNELFPNGGLPNFGDTYIDPQNKQKYPMYRLNKHYTLVLVSGYSATLRDKIISRLEFLELENARLQKEKEQRGIQRELAKLGNPRMTLAIKELKESQGKELKSYYFSNENDMLNKIVFGFDAQGLRAERNITEESLRDSPKILALELKALEDLQDRNRIYIEDGLDYQTRKDKLTNYFNMKYKTKLLGA